MGGTLRKLLRIASVLGIVALCATLGLAALVRVVSARNARPLDAWIVPSLHEVPMEAGYERVQVAWVLAPLRVDAEARLADVVAVPIEDPALLRQMIGDEEPPRGRTGCTPHLVRAMEPLGQDPSQTRVYVKGDTIDVGLYGGFGCRLSASRRAPLVACLDTTPRAVLTSFRCEPIGPLFRLIAGKGDRWR